MTFNIAINHFIISITALVEAFMPLFKLKFVYNLALEKDSSDEVLG
jgi:hypothetical protein